MSSVPHGANTDLTGNRGNGEKRLWIGGEICRRNITSPNLVLQMIAPVDPQRIRGILNPWIIASNTDKYEACLCRYRTRKIEWRLSPDCFSGVCHKLFDTKPNLNFLDSFRLLKH